MNKLLLCSGLAAAATLPFTADAFGFAPHFGHGGGTLGVVLVVAVIVAVVVLVQNASRR